MRSTYLSGQALRSLHSRYSTRTINIIPSHFATLSGPLELQCHFNIVVGSVITHSVPWRCSFRGPRSGIKLNRKKNHPGRHRQRASATRSIDSHVPFDPHLLRHDAAETVRRHVRLQDARLLCFKHVEQLGLDGRVAPVLFEAALRDPGIHY